MAFIVNCLHCKNSFEAKSRAQKFDTKECELAHRQANRSAFFSPTVLTIKCVQCGKDFNTKSKKQQVCSKDCLLQQELTDAAKPKEHKNHAWSPFKGDNLPSKKEGSNNAAVETITDFINSIDALGGVVKCDENTYCLAAYDECYTLADAYVKACKLVERIPKVVDHSMKEHRDCVVCGGITANKCTMSCKHRDYVCNECKSLGPTTLCHKCEEGNFASQVA